MVYIGCSGYYYPSWQPGFYPEDLPKSKWFKFYSEQFNTLEINNTFYKFPTAASLKKIYLSAPAGFAFSIKAPRLITHFKQLKNCKEQLDDFYNSVHEGMKEKAGALLFQFPPKFIYSEERIQLIKDAMDPSSNNVVEFRDKSWWSAKVIKLLRQNKIHVSGISHPDLPGDLMGDKEITYYRFHGVPELYLSSYKKETLQNVADKINTCKSKNVFVYFNNTITIAGAKNAKTIRKMILIQ